MNQIDFIYTTISDGQVHIAADTKYIGSVDSYNNCFTQLFAWALDRSMTVNFDGKIRSVNKESYANLIRSLTRDDEIKDIYQRSIFRPIAEDGFLPMGNLKMRDVINKNDRQELFKKLAVAISRGDTAKALLMIGKGAELDAVYYDRAGRDPSFSKDSSGLYSDSRYAFTVFKAAPVLQAARKGNAVVCRFLKEAGANLSVKGNEYFFRREIIAVDRYLEVTYKPKLVSCHHYFQDANGNEYEHVSKHIEREPVLQTRTAVFTEDSRSDEKNYQLDPIFFRALEVR